MSDGKKDKDNEWWEAYKYDEDELNYLIPNYKIERFKNEVKDLKAELEKSRELIREMYRPLKEYSILIRGFEVHKGISKSEILSIKEIAKEFLKIKEGE